MKFGKNPHTYWINQLQRLYEKRLAAQCQIVCSPPGKVQQ